MDQIKSYGPIYRQLPQTARATTSELFACGDKVGARHAGRWFPRFKAV
jgi:hypothetical protein